MSIRTVGVFGELVLREAPDGHHEIVSNGVFLMDTRDGRSERGLVDEALAVADGDQLHVLVAGLGVGFTLGAALASDRVGRVTVVELEPSVVELVRSATGERTGADLDDPRVTLVVGDVVEVLTSAGGDGAEVDTVDVLCLDVDNGPGWTLGEDNDRLYTDEGIALAADVLAPGGVLSVWSASEDALYAARLRQRFARVATHRWEVPRGAPDIVWVATG